MAASLSLHVDHARASSGGHGPRRRRRGGGTVRIVTSGTPPFGSPLRLSFPAEGIGADGVTLRFPSLEDVDAILPAFTDPELREAGNLPAFDREALAASIQELPLLADAGRLLALAAVDARGEVVGGG